MSDSNQGKPIWLDLGTSDPKAAGEFYAGLFGWQHQDLGPEAGGYGFFLLDGKQVSGVGPLQSEGQPTAWSIYFGSADADATARTVEEAGGTVVAPPFDVFDSGRMGVFQDPTGAFFSVWQPNQMAGFQVSHEPNSYDWAELNARGLEKAVPFYQQVFGWSAKRSEGEMPYTEWQLDGHSHGGAQEMNPMVPAQVPSYWMVYFKVADVDQAVQKAEGLGATVMMPGTDFPGGRFAIFSDPQGAVLGVMT